mmetsp:Transcript_11796/g.38768  ORF Transcript_11796/g.38768 Transcript_11796/m.38768 type:complete len:228 (+) Transcript_11796:207-890(+)
MIGIPCLRPDADGFRRETAVAERHNREAPRLEHALHLLENLERLREVVHAHSVGDDVERVVLVRKLWVVVEVTHVVRSEDRVALQLLLIHAEADNLARGITLRVVRDPRRANVEKSFAFVARRRELLCVPFRERLDGSVINVCNEARVLIEDGVRALIEPLERLRREWPLLWELRLLEHLRDGAARRGSRVYRLRVSRVHRGEPAQGEEAAHPKRYSASSRGGFRCS